MLLQHLPAVYLVKGYMAEPPTNHEVRVHNGEKFLVLWVLKALPLLDYVEKQALRFGWEPSGEWLYDFVEPLGMHIHDDIDHELPDDEYAYRLIGWLIDKSGEFFVDSQGEAVSFGSEVLRKGLEAIELPSL